MNTEYGRLLDKKAFFSRQLKKAEKENNEANIKIYISASLKVNYKLLELLRKARLSK